MDNLDAINNPDQRFGSNEISRQMLHDFSGLAMEVSTKNPWIVGNTLIGSIALGTAHRETENEPESDVDAHWFYDSSKIGAEVIAENVSDREKKWNTDEQAQKKVAALNAVTRAVKEKFGDHFTQGTADNAFRDLLGSPEALVHDVNPEVLHEVIYRLGEGTYIDDEDLSLALSTPDAYPLKFIFLGTPSELGAVGYTDQLDGYRRIVLDELQKTKHGERMFQRLMNDMSMMERPEESLRIPYRRYPKNIDEARKHFHLM